MDKIRWLAVIIFVLGVVILFFPPSGTIAGFGLMAFGVMIAVVSFFIEKLRDNKGLRDWIGRG